MSQQRYSSYRCMWVFVFFDLPTDTAGDRRNASNFRKELLKDGFVMFQFSIYMRHCYSRENSKVHVKRVESFLNLKGSVSVIEITDKQFLNIKTFFGRERMEVEDLRNDQLIFL